MALPFVLDEGRPAVNRFLRHHKMLMLLFLVQYVVIACALALKLSLVSELLLGAVFFLIAVFIYLSSLMEAKLLSEMQKTMNGILPVCSKCRKMLSPDSDPGKQESWLKAENYFAVATGKLLSHGLCPACQHSAISEHEESQHHKEEE